MVINDKKSLVMTLGFSQAYSFPPDLVLSDNEPLLEVSEAKLLGVMLQTNLRWDSHTEYICARAASRLWTLRRLRALGLDTRILFDVYAKEIRSILEMATAIVISR